MKTTTLNQDQVNKLFETKNHQQDILLSIYKMVFPDYDEIKKLHGYTAISENTNNHLFKQFIRFDKIHHPDVMAGGLWMNNGFSTDHNIQQDFQVTVDESVIEYKQPCTVLVSVQFRDRANLREEDRTNYGYSWNMASYSAG